MSEPTKEQRAEWAREMREDPLRAPARVYRERILALDAALTTAEHEADRWRRLADERGDQLIVLAGRIAAQSESD